MALSTQPVVKVVDEHGYTVTSSSVAISLSVVSGPGVLSGSASVSASLGVASFSGLVLDKAGTYVLRASASGELCVCMWGVADGMWACGGVEDGMSGSSQL